MKTTGGLSHTEREGFIIMERYGSCVRLHPEKIEEYKRLHAAVWPQVLEMITRCHIRNYTIFLHDGWLFSYFEYTGDDFQQDMDRMAADPVTQEWWKVCTPCFDPECLPEKKAWWIGMEEIFHLD